MKSPERIDAGLYAYLRGYLSEARLARFEHILDNRTRHFTLVLEDIFHSPNAGAVVRTCECFGIQDIYVIENSKPFKLNTRVVRGSAKWTTLRRTDSSEQCVAELRAAGYRIAATTLRGDKPLIVPEAIPVDEKVALCMGSEETGLSDYIHEQADYYVHIPMYGFTQSLNISVSAALCLRAMLAKLRDSGVDWRLTEDEKQQLREHWVQHSVKHLGSLLRHYDSTLAERA